MRISRVLAAIAVLLTVVFLFSCVSCADGEREWLDSVSGYDGLISDSPVAEDGLGAEALFEAAKDTAVGAWKALLGRLPSLFAVVCLMWVLKTLCPAKNGREIMRAVEIYASVYVLCTLLPEMATCAEKTVAAKDELGGILTGAVSVICFCAEAEGFAGAAGVATGWFSTELGLFVFITEQVIMPLLTLFLCLGLTAAVTGQKTVGALSSAVRKTLVFVLAASASVFLSALFFSVRAQTSSDGLLKRTAAAVIGKSIPVVGTVLGNNLETVSVYFDDIIGKTGFYAVCVTAYYVLPVMLSCMAEMLFLSVVRLLFSFGGMERGADVFGICRDAIVLLFSVISVYGALTVLGFGILMGV